MTMADRRNVRLFPFVADDARSRISRLIRPSTAKQSAFRRKNYLLNRKLAACVVGIAIVSIIAPSTWGGKGGKKPPPDFRYTFVDLLGFPDRGYQSSADFITEPSPSSGRRLIAGLSRLYPDPDGPAIFHPAVWDVASDGSFAQSDPQDLGLPPWIREARVGGLSEMGVVAASTNWARYRDPDDTYWDGEKYVGRWMFPGYLDVPGWGYLQLPTPDERPNRPFGVRYRNSSVRGMNDNHVVIGSHETLLRVEPDGTNVWGSVSAMWQLDIATGVISMPVSLGAFAPLTINNDGMMTGHYLGQAVICRGLDANGDPIVEPLETLAGYDGSQPKAISENGQWVAGYAEVYVEGRGWYQEACVWNITAGTVQGLGTLSRKGWNGSSIASGVNNAGQVVGRSDTGRRIPTVAFLWEGSSLIDLNTLVDTGSNNLAGATGISNDGRIIGTLGDPRASESRGFLLLPISD
jgi:probable HAF family extracellular repeat protein